MAGQAVITERDSHAAERAVVRHPQEWTSSYLRLAALLDGAGAVTAGALALVLRFVIMHQRPVAYIALSAALAPLWCASLALAGGYDARVIGIGSDEFRRVLNSALGLTAGLAITSYAFRIQIARGYMAIAMPSVLAIDLLARYALRKRLHRLRATGRYMQRVIAVGHAAAVADLIAELRRGSYHGMTVVGACLAESATLKEIADVPVCGGLDGVESAVRDLGAHSVAVLACPEMNGIRLRELAWQLEKTATDLCVASALLDVAGPRTTIRPVAGLPLLHLDHAELGGARQLVKGAFDRIIAGLGLIILLPLFGAIALATRAEGRGPVFFRQTRVGKNGRTFRMFKFRTMVVDAEHRKAQLQALNDVHGALFKMRRDPRVTRVGSWLRRWSLDELPQLINVLKGDMSLVGPRPALPEETARYGDYVRRRLAVKPGLTGLWQVSGRSELPWEDAVRLDLRYVENWSLALDLQILWKTVFVVIHGRGAY